MERRKRFLITAALVFGLSCWFFAIQPWMDAITGWRKWLLIVERAGELLALYALAHGLSVWAVADAKRWKWITNGCRLAGVALLIHSLDAYLNLSAQMASPLLPGYITQWVKVPYIMRIALALLMLLAGAFRAVTERHRLFLFGTVIALGLYWLIPEIYLFLHPV